MAKGLKIEVVGLELFSNVNEVVHNAVKDAMDDIKDDAVITARGQAPVDTGKLEKSYYVRSKNVPLKRCDFSITFRAINNGFNYAVWTHDATYNLGKKSRAKKPIRSRFMKGRLQVGQGYLQRTYAKSQDSWKEFILNNVLKKTRQAMMENRKKKKK